MEKSSRQRWFAAVALSAIVAWAAGCGGEETAEEESCSGASCGSAGAGGSGGSAGTNPGGSGGTGGGEEQGPSVCEAMCEHVYLDCGEVFGDARTGEPMTESQCAAACERGVFGAGVPECLLEAACTQTAFGACLQTENSPECNEMCANVYGCGFDFQTGSGTLTEEECAGVCTQGSFTAEEIECFSAMECGVLDYYTCSGTPPSETCLETCDKLLNECNLGNDQSEEAYAACAMVCTYEWSAERVACLAENSCETIRFCE